MKICRFEKDNKIYFGKIEDQNILTIPAFNYSIFDLDSIANNDSIKLSEVEKFLPPVIPSKIVCVGRNYAEHAAELGNEVPKEPLLFLKAPSTLITEGEQIEIPPQSDQVEHEGELAIVIGRKCKNLSENIDPRDYILGYMCLNDVTARDIQRKDVQFTRGKSFDTFCPVSKFIETDFEYENKNVSTKVNEVVKQAGNISQMVFPIPFLIRYISNQMTLNPGDVIATGTPSGVSKLNDGDSVVVEIEGLGKIENSVIKAS